MRRSIATVSLSGTLDERLSAAAHAGFDAVELFESDFVTNFRSAGQVRARAAGLGLSIDVYQPFHNLEGTPPREFSRTLKRAAHKLDLMEQLGARTLVVSSSVSPHTVADDELAAEQLRTVAELAVERGLCVAYEALAWGRHVNDYLHAWRIVQRADHDALGLCLDSFHMLSRGDDHTLLRSIPGNKIFLLQLADAPRLAMNLVQWSAHHRCFPGQGELDLVPLVAAALQAGYTGPLSIEVFNDVLRQSDPERTARDGLRSLLTLEDAVRRDLDKTTSGVRIDVDLATTPEAPEPTGFAFVELAVDTGSASAAAVILGGLGFRQTGRHRTKPVHLWENGGARALLNLAGKDHVRNAPVDAVLSALAVETADPGRAAARAEHLLAHALPRDREASEADLTAVGAPDGTAVFFCRSDASDANAWLGDFIIGRHDEQDTSEAGSPPTSSILGIDHIGLPQPFDRFEEAALFYCSILGLRPQQLLELPALNGLVRSRALCTEARGVRIALNAALVGRGDSAHRSPEPQHVAFACSDVPAAARAMRDNGVPRLIIPDNYYDDLATHSDLSAERVEELRELGVLYDGGAAGVYLHMYTPMLGERMFFELVQRSGSYDGYAPGNAPVRMAAQRRFAAPASQAQ